MADFYVATNGKDEWSGRVPAPDGSGSEGPFATIVRAQAAVRALVKEAPANDVVVEIRGGTYHLDETLVFGPEDSGHPARVVYRAFEGETPIVSGGRRVGGWRRVESAPPGLPASALSHLWVCEIDGWIRTLYRGDERLDRARSEGFIPIVANAQGEDALLADRAHLRFPVGTISAARIDEVELLIIPRYPWFFDLLSLESVDESSGVATTSTPASYPMEPVKPLEGSGRPTAWIENCFEALDAPGRWVVTRTGGHVQLYLISESEGPPEGIIAPRMCELLRLEGDDTPGNVTRGLTFEGLTFAHGDRYVPGDGSRYGYGRHDAPNAMVRLKGAEECFFRTCRFVAGGDVGIRIDAPARGNRITGCTFERLGGTGMMLCGRREITSPYTNSGNEIADNVIRRCAGIHLSTSGIYLWQSDENHVHHNIVSEMPHNGMMLLGSARVLTREELIALGIEPPAERADQVEGYRRALPHLPARGNLIEYNEIHHVMELLGDGNALYIDSAGAGNVVSRNYFHDITGYGCQSALRTDDFQSGTTMRENLIVRCVGGGITLKQVNDIEGNVIANLLPKRRADGTVTPPDGYILLRRGPSAGSKIHRNVFYHVGGAQQFYCEGKIKRWPLAFARECDVDYNLYYCTDDPGHAARFLEEKRAEGIDAHSIAEDPRFRDPSRDDYTPAPDSPVTRLGITPLGPGEAGPRTRGATGE